jgi:transcriptional regulator with XRE-family HTH domain
MSPRDAMRAHLARLREGQEISQEKIAEVLGMTRKSWGDYERGHTLDLRYGDVMIVFRYLKGSFSDMPKLTYEGVTAEEGRRLADARLE